MEVTTAMHDVFPGVFHLEDRMGVHMTLLTGQNSAVLFDTGYGIDDVAAMVREITPLPVTVILSHAHHDHALGCRWFQEVFLHPAELPVYRTYTGDFWRKSVLANAAGKGISVSEETFLSSPAAKPVVLEKTSFDLGGMSVLLQHSPGHTPGSMTALIPEHRLLLTGDDWNPVTWCFFPEALPVQSLLASLRAVLSLPFDSVLCPHSGELFHRHDLESFLDSITEDALKNAVPTDLGGRFGVDARMVETPDGRQLHFDYLKAFPH